MKKLLSLLLTLALLACCVSAFAEGTAVPMQEGDPAGLENLHYYASSVQFGSDIVAASDNYVSYWASSGFSIEKDGGLETLTLTDGTKVQAQAFKPAAELYNGNQMTGKLFLMKGTVFAGCEDFTMPEGRDGSVMEKQLNDLLGASEPLDPTAFSSIAEMLGDSFRLEEGQPLWTYTTTITLPAVNQTTQVKAYLTVRFDEGHAYLTEWVVLGSSDSASTQNVAGLEGFSELTAEEKNALAVYAEYLEEQKKSQLQQFLNYMRQKHQNP